MKRKGVGGSGGGWPGVWLFVFLLGAGCPLSAQLEKPEGPAKYNLGDVSEKFIRNMKVLRAQLNDAESQKMVDVVCGKAQDLAALYRAGGAAANRRILLDEQDAITHKDKISASDQRRIDELQAAIKKSDPDNSFGRGRQEIQQSIGELQAVLGQLHSPDVDTQDILRLIQQHLQLYQYALNKYQ